MFAQQSREQSKKPAEGKPGRDVSTLERKEARQSNPIWQSLALRPAFIHPKLNVSQANDPHELEADRVADKVMRMPQHQVQRKCDACETAGSSCPTCADDVLVQRKAEGAEGPMTAPDSTAGQLGAGHPLEPGTRAFFEPRFGQDLSDVRIHTDGVAADAAMKLDAQAFAIGQHIAFAQGQYAPDSTHGRRLIAHELTHVLQSDAPMLHRSAAPANQAEAPPKSGERPTANQGQAVPATTPAPSTPTCTMPVFLGSGRGCGSGTDFTHHDFPSISTASEVIMGAWAYAHPGVYFPIRDLISDSMCELEMHAVLFMLGMTPGDDAFLRFRAGTGGTETHNNTSLLGMMARTSASFLATVGAVKAVIETQLAIQAASGALNPCGLSVTPPATEFLKSDGLPLKTVIGGTQGERLFATSFTGNIPLRTYTITLRFLICDHFGVDEHDLYAPGLIPFWILQHERSATLYAPFINELDLTMTVTGTF